IAVACEPITMQTNRITGEIPVEFAMTGTIGNSAGATTPKVEAKTDMNAAISVTAKGISQSGIVVETQSDSWSITPASMATEIIIPTPEISRRVFNGTEAKTAF